MFGGVYKVVPGFEIQKRGGRGGGGGETSLVLIVPVYLAGSAFD